MFIEEFADTSQFSSGEYGFVGAEWRSEHDIFPDGRVEQGDILGYVTNVSSQISWVQLVYICSADQNAALRQVVKVHYQFL